MKRTLKVVDTFNGWEGPSFASREAARQWLDKDCEAFYANLGTQNARYCKAIVPIAASWGWDQRQNTFTWD